MPILRPLRNRTLNPHPEPPTPQKKPGPASRHPPTGPSPSTNRKANEENQPRNPDRTAPNKKTAPTQPPHYPHPHPDATPPAPPRQAPHPTQPRNPNPDPTPKMREHTFEQPPHRPGRTPVRPRHTPNSSPTSPRREPFPATKPKAPKGRSPESAKSADRVVLFKGFKVLNFLNRAVQTRLPRTLLRTVPGTVPEQFPEQFEPFPHSENAYTSSPTDSAEKETKPTPKSRVNTARRKEDEGSQPRPAIPERDEHHKSRLWRKIHFHQPAPSFTV